MDESEKTDRITFRHLRDNLVEIIIFQKGLPRTCKELVVRPGFVLSQYLYTSDRVNYAKPFNSALILIGVLTLALVSSGFSGSFLSGFLTAWTEESASSASPVILKKVLTALFVDYPSLLFILWIPLNGVLCKLMFKKSSLNLAEHFIVNAYLLLIQSVIGVIGSITAYLFGEDLILLFVLPSIAYQFFLYFDFYQKRQSVNHAIVKTLVIVLIGFAMYLVASVLVGIVAAGVFYFGKLKKENGERSRLIQHT